MKIPDIGFSGRVAGNSSDMYRGMYSCVWVGYGVPAAVGHAINGNKWIGSPAAFLISLILIGILSDSPESVVRALTLEWMRSSGAVVLDHVKGCR